VEREKLHPILNNIHREVDAIRGYIIDPVEGGDEIIVDEISHIFKLASQLMKACKPGTAEVMDDIAEKAEDIADGEQPAADKTDDD